MHPFLRAARISSHVGLVIEVCVFDHDLVGFNPDNGACEFVDIDD
jgi:hypothetical protein